MAKLPASSILDLADAGARQSPVERALTMLAYAWPESDTDFAALPVDARDERLYAIHRETVGPELAWIATCPACDAVVESKLDLRTLPPATSEARLKLRFGPWRVTSRLPDSRDLAVAAAASDAAAARRLLAERVIVSARRAGNQAGASLPDELIAAVGAALAEWAPLAEVVLSVTCPECGSPWQLPLDIASFLWDELEAQARGLLVEVDALARSYGWTEPEILSLPSRRRARYLELALA